MAARLARWRPFAASDPVWAARVWAEAESLASPWSRAGSLLPRRLNWLAESAGAGSAILRVSTATKWRAPA